MRQHQAPWRCGPWGNTSFIGSASLFHFQGQGPAADEWPFGCRLECLGAGGGGVWAVRASGVGFRARGEEANTLRLRGLPDAAKRRLCLPFATKLTSSLHKR